MYGFILSLLCWRRRYACYLNNFLSTRVLINILRKRDYWFCDQHRNGTDLSFSLPLRLKALVSTGGRNVQAACDWWVITHTYTHPRPDKSEHNYLPAAFMILSGLLLWPLKLITMCGCYKHTLLLNTLHSLALSLTLMYLRFCLDQLCVCIIKLQFYH